MTFVREIEEGDIRVALGSELGAALNGHDHSFVCYIRFSLEEGFSPLLTFAAAEFEHGEKWSAFRRTTEEKEPFNKLAFVPGPYGGVVPAETWGLAIATWEEASTAYHFFFYNLKTHALEDLGSGEFAEGLTWEAPDPAVVQFGGEDKGSPNFLDGNYAAAAIFDKALSSAEIESLAKANSVEAWASRGPKGLWIFDQEKTSEEVVDIMGHGADQGAIEQRGKTRVVDEEGGLPQLPLRNGEEPEREELRVNVRLVGNVSGKVYCVGSIVATSLYRDPDVYLGYCHLALPFKPIPAPHNLERPELDPTDTEVILQAFVLSEGTVFADHWLGTFERRPKALIELPDTFIID